MTYADFIAEHWPDRQSAYGRCQDAAAAMAAQFPELTLTRGHYYCTSWGERQHWWCVGPSGEIVDPTAIQFPSAGQGVYVPWVEGEKEPTGRCPNCGGYVYDGGTVCSDECARSYEAYILRGSL